MTVEELEHACTAFEDEFGMEAFLDALAEIMRRKMAEHGIELDLGEQSAWQASEKPPLRRH